MFRVLLVEGLDADAETRLARGAEVVRLKGATVETLCESIADCDAVVARTHTPLTRAVIEAGRRLRVIGVAGVGVDRVDLEAAQARGVLVLHKPAASSDAVAEFTVGLMLQLLRPYDRARREYAAGRFAESRAQASGAELRELTVGVLGMGRIGSRVARICAAGFGARVLYTDIVPVGPFAFEAESVEWADLLARSDILTLHTPLTPTTRGLFDASVFARMRAGSRLINAARGAIVETPALVEALESGCIAGAALDVTEPEPLPPAHPLFHIDNCLLTPHLAARTPGGMKRMYDIVDDVLAALASESDP